MLIRSEDKGNNGIKMRLFTGLTFQAVKRKDKKTIKIYEFAYSV